MRGGAGSVSLGLGRNGLDLRDVGDDGCALLEKLALPLGERLSSLGLASGLVALDETVSGGIRDDAGEQAHRTDRVVVTGNRVLELVRVGVGVEDADNGDAELLGLVDCEVLALGVDDVVGSVAGIDPR